MKAIPAREQKFQSALGQRKHHQGSSPCSAARSWLWLWCWVQVGIVAGGEAPYRRRVFEILQDIGAPPRTLHFALWWGVAGGGAG